MKDQLAEQLNQWLLQKAERTSAGDALFEPRVVEHFAVFKTKTDAQVAARELVECGHECFIDRAGLFKFHLSATRRENLLDDSVEKFVSQVLSIVLNHNGFYDGFGAEVID